ncbi:hypothetical protein [Collimonas arenae]|uniref:hypothetical protein n=1 Tax=Collimonas arenae TaxID=279058 RepID=UPI000FE147B1|nr:hypothetical protein [Collimonas arenae]
MRGIIAGVVAKVIGIPVCILVNIFVIWPAIHNAPYGSSGPLDVNSNEWFIYQIPGALAYFLTGFVAARWSPPASWRAPLFHIGLSVVILLLSHLPNINEVWRKVFWFVYPLLCIYGGALYFQRRERMN